MEFTNKNKLIRYAFFTALATTIYWLESIAVRVFPFPFLRIGLANVVIVYLLMRGEVVFALTVNIMKTLLGGLASLTLMSPATLLSLCGGIGSLIIMWLLYILPIKFSILGISMAGAVVHNIIQVLCVRWLIIPKDSVLYLLPILMLLGLVTGLITGVIAYELSKTLEGTEECPEASI